MTRKPLYAGSFYELGFKELEKQITHCFNHKLGPGALPLNKRTKLIKAVIAPHAGYIFSGPCAAWAYKEIAESKFADLYILIGPNHRGTGSSISMENWETPFGLVRIDQDFAKLLIKKSKLKIDEDSHQAEHSIEVQLPFLQFVSKDKMHQLKILPILIDHDVDIKKLALDLKEVIVESKKDVVFIVSSDFTHYGRNYSYLPFTTDVKKRIYELDGGAIELIKNMDADGFLKYTHENITTICGSMGIALLLKTLKAEKINLEQYYTSADILKQDYKNSVSYASIVFV